MMSSRSRSRSAATILVAVLLPVALASAQGVRPVGDVKDHPVPPRASSDEAEALLDELNLDDVPQESMQSLFNWAIEHSDPERLREMAAEAAAAGGRGGDGAPRVPDAPLPDGDAASKVQPGRRHTEAELLAKREEVKQALDALASNPTEQQYIKQATEMYLDRTRGKADRLLALEELEDLVGPVDNANDLHVLGALVPLVRTAIDPTIDDDIGAAAASALGVAASNNHRVVALAQTYRDDDDDDEKTGGSVDPVAAAANKPPSGDPRGDPVARLAALATDETRPLARRSKSLFALSAMVRDYLPARRRFFAAGGVDAMLALLRSGSPPKLRERAVALVTDFWNVPDVAGGPAERGYPPGRRDEERALASAATPHLVDATTAGGADAREKALEALRAATERISGEHGKNARRAAIGAGAAEALERLGAFFEAEAAAETDPERGEYVLALADDARAAAGNLAPAVAPTRTDAHNEL